ncbi:MAG: hypothetical protein R3F53_19980 [Gammaproteobacteria bacterium]
MLRISGMCCVLLWLAGCASYGVIQNSPVATSKTARSYSLQAWSEGSRSGDIALLLAFFRRRHAGSGYFIRGTARAA